MEPSVGDFVSRSRCSYQNYYYEYRNIFLKQNGQIKLADFGISREFDDSTSLISTFVGTHQYMSPEMKSRQQYSYKTDCWLVKCFNFKIFYIFNN